MSDHTQEDRDITKQFDKREVQMDNQEQQLDNDQDWMYEDILDNYYRNRKYAEENPTKPHAKSMLKEAKTRLITEMRERK